MDISGFIKNALFPKYCFGCHKIGTYICPMCESKLRPVSKDICAYCARASYFGLTHPGCYAESRLDGLISFYYYSPLARRLIKAIKYRLVTDAISDLCNTISDETVTKLFFYNSVAPHATFIPVPLHTKRLALRGFNQSAQLALYFSKKLSIRYDDALIERIKNTKPQAQLKTTRERFLNIKGAFALVHGATSHVHDGNFILVDDVWTSGSTIKEMGRVLKKNGANRVYALTLVR